MRLLPSPWLLLALSAALAGGMGWLALHQRDRARDAERALEAADRAIASVNEYATELQERSARQIERLEVLANVPDTATCGPGVTRALELLRGDEQ